MVAMRSADSDLVCYICYLMLDGASPFELSINSVTLLSFLPGADANETDKSKSKTFD